MSTLVVIHVVDGTSFAFPLGAFTGHVSFLTATEARAALHKAGTVSIRKAGKGAGLVMDLAAKSVELHSQVVDLHGHGIGLCSGVGMGGLEGGSGCGRGGGRGE